MDDLDLVTHDDLLTRSIKSSGTPDSRDETLSRVIKSPMTRFTMARATPAPMAASIPRVPRKTSSLSPNVKIRWN
jgi:hypothetical protein